MARYLITGTRAVAGHAPGETIEDDALAGYDIDALILGGHITQARATRKTTQDPAPEED